MRKLLFLLAIPLLGQNTAIFPNGTVTNNDLLIAPFRFQTTLRSQVNPTDTTINVVSTTGLPALGAGKAVVVVIDNEEIRITGITSNTLTTILANRGFDGTVAASHVSGSGVFGYLTPWHHNQMAAELIAIENNLYPTVLMNPPANSISPGFKTTQTGPISGNQNQAIDYNSINILSDQANSGPVANYVRGLNVNMHIGGPNMSGPRVGIASNLTLDAASSPTSSNRDYVASQGVCSINATDNGTAPTIGSARGSCYAFNGVAQSGALNLFELAGGELDVGGTGSFAVRFGLNVVGTYTQQGTAYDAGLVVGASTAPWKNGLLFTHLNSAAPMSTNGCAICTDGVNDTIATGLDFSSYTISGNFLAGPGGIKVTGTGDGWLRSLSVIGNIPSCSSTGLGTGTCTLDGFSTNSAGSIILSPIGSPSSTGNITLTFNGGLGVHSTSCNFTYKNGSGGWNVPGQFQTISSSTVSALFNWGQAGNLTAGLTYWIDYECFGR